MLIFLVFLLRAGNSSVLFANEPTNSGLAFFEKEIRPLLADKCWKCHGESKAESGLRLHTREAVMKGGKRGPAALEKTPLESLLLKVVSHQGKLSMPPKEKLAPVDLARLQQWVALGLPWTKEKAKAPANPGNHWAFLPLAKSPLPILVNNRAWASHPIDLFILEKLNEKGFAPPKPASKNAWLRRVTFNLTGLPPTPGEFDEFLTDTTPYAREKVVDRLLASPHYGEKWGRHWLDLARYSDSNGMDENLVQGNAWRYRDYVIEAMNQDRPYGQFIQEQLAGDLLKSPMHQGAIATGFLSLGPKMLAEDDPVKMQMDIIDEQIDTLGKVFLGMSLGCARCHDHKYDPITMGDYYSLAGIFKSTKVMENYRVVARWVEKPVGQAEEVQHFESLQGEMTKLKKDQTEKFRQAKEALVEQEKKKIERYVKAAKEWNLLEAAQVSLEDVKNLPPGARVIEAEAYTQGNALRSTTGYGEKIGVIYNAGELPNRAVYEFQQSQAVAVQLHIRYAAQESRPIEIRVNGKVIKTGAGLVTGGWHPQQQKWERQCLVSLKEGKNQIEFFRQGPFPHLDKFALVPPEKGEEKTQEQFAQEQGLHPHFLGQWSQFLKRQPPGDPEKFAANPKGAFAIADNQFQVFAKPLREELDSLQNKITEKEKNLPVLPEAMMANEGDLTTLRIHLRGNHLTLGEEVSRGVPAVFHQRTKMAAPVNQSGRLQLAQWLASEENSLARRVVANRIWHWHFGKGLVRTPDNFGTLGDSPSHPELLDWLAGRFTFHGGSFKSMHREILLSNTYGMACADNSRAAFEDPDNRLFWTFPRRRLDAEEIRDAILSHSVMLDPSMRGSIMKGKNRGYVPGYPNGKYDDYDSPRRSVYLPLIRSMLFDLFQSFDFPDPSMTSGERAQTTVAQQALFSLNGKIMASGPAALARALHQQSPADKSRQVSQAMKIVWCRPAANTEITGAVDFLQLLARDWQKEGKPSLEAEQLALQGFIRVLLSSNEFLFLE